MISFYSFSAELMVVQYPQQVNFILSELSVNFVFTFISVFILSSYLHRITKEERLIFKTLVFVISSPPLWAWANVFLSLNRVYLVIEPCSNGYRIFARKCCLLTLFDCNNQIMCICFVSLWIYAWKSIVFVDGEILSIRFALILRLYWFLFKNIL